MCSPKVTLFVPGQNVTVGKRHYSHAYLLKKKGHLGPHDLVAIGVVTIGVNICTSTLSYRGRELGLF